MTTMNEAFKEIVNDHEDIRARHKASDTPECTVVARVVIGLSINERERVTPPSDCVRAIAYKWLRRGAVDLETIDDMIIVHQPPSCRQDCIGAVHCIAQQHAVAK